MKQEILRVAGFVRELSPESAALILTVGLVLGTFPVYGCPTALCFLAVVCFRLNGPALYLVNQVTSPLQFALVLPFARVGARVLPLQANGSGDLFSRAGGITLQAVAGWFILAVPLGLVLYAGFVLTLRRNRCRPVIQ